MFPMKPWNPPRWSIGKKSGPVSIAHKVTELNLDLGTARFPELLDCVKAQAVEKHRSLTDAEFIALATEVCS